MDFAVIDDAASRGLQSKEGEAWIATADLEGLDLTDGATVSVSGSSDEARPFVLRGSRKLPRRVVLLHEADRNALGVEVGPLGANVMVVEVPRLDRKYRVTIEDTQTPSPGADAFRWFFYASSPPWTNTRHSLSNVRSAQKEFQIKLRNVYSFFTIYANIDGFDPSEGIAEWQGLDAAALASGKAVSAIKDRPLLDRWMLSELALTVRDVTSHLEAYRVHESALRLIDCVDALSNWYVRRSRERFWAAGFSQDKRDAYWTLYTSLTTLARLCAPFIPFFAEEIYQNLVRRPWPASQPLSVHLCQWPELDEKAVDEALSVEMKAVRDIVSLGLQVRTNNRLKVRQPLRSVDVVLANRALKDRMKAYESLIRSELNVHEVHWLDPGQEGKEVVYKLKPNFRALGPKLGKRVQEAKTALAKADAGELRTRLVTDGKIVLDLPAGAIELGPEEIEISVEAAEGFAAAGDAVGVVVLHTTLDDALIDEGLERECLSRLQAIRKELNLPYTARIRVAIDGSKRLRRILAEAKTRLAQEVLASEFLVGQATFEPETTKEASIDGEPIVIRVLRASE